MATFGGITCTFIKGHRRGLKQRVEVWNVPGFDGFGAHLLGKGDSEFRFLLVLYGTNSAIETWIGQVEAKQGQKITIIDDWTVTFLDCLVTRIGDPQKSPDAINGGRCELMVEGTII